MIEINGVLRPRQNSHGLLIHPTEDGIRNFWAWFGDSKTVDEHGRPHVMVHGTFEGAIDEFKGNNGFWFCPQYDTSEADIIASEGSERLPNPNPDELPDVAVGAVFYLTYLRIINPAPAIMEDQFYDHRIQTKDVIKQGYDGFIWEDGVAVALKPDQVKSAIGNSGEFSKNTNTLCDHQRTRQSIFESDNQSTISDDDYDFSLI